MVITPRIHMTFADALRAALTKLGWTPERIEKLFRDTPCN